MVPGGRLLIDIGHKYNACKVVYFIVIEDSGIMKTLENRSGYLLGSL